MEIFLFIFTSSISFYNESLYFLTEFDILKVVIFSLQITTFSFYENLIINKPKLTRRLAGGLIWGLKENT